MSLDRAVREALDGAKPRPGLVVIGATDRTETFVAGRGPLPAPDCPPERALFEIGSLTKVFTALLLAIAVERGEAALDDPLVEHLPAGTRVPRRDGVVITLAHLATHTSGLPRLPPGFLREALRHRRDPYARLTAERVLDALGRTRQRRPAGSRMVYSNFGAGLLGLALAHTAGADVDFEMLVRERITGPIGMADTVVALDAGHRARLAPGYTWRGKPTGLWSFPGLAGAGAFRSTAADLLVFARAQLGVRPPEVPEELAAAIATTHRPRSRGRRLIPGMRLGLGWMMVPSFGRTKLNMVWHEGGTGGYRSFLGFAPSAGPAVVVLSANARKVGLIGFGLLYRLAAPRRQPSA